MGRTRQRTLRTERSYVGIGIHTGQEATMTFKPAPAGTGVEFVRVDLPGAPPIPARIGCVMTNQITPRRTALSRSGVRINTVEHVLAAIAGLGIDNIIVELDSDEPAEPADGSCKPFVEILTEAGFAEQDAPLQYLEVAEPITFDDGDVHLSASPYDGLRVSFTIDYENPIIGTLFASFEIE